MEKAKDTPWTADEAPPTRRHILIRNANRDPVAYVYTGGWDKTSIKIHKNLILKAPLIPESLSACKAVLSYLPAKDGKRISSDPDGDVQLMIANQLKAIIAKLEKP